MSIFVMLGTYSDDALKLASSQRTRRAASLIEENGGTVQAIYALLGEHDLIVISEFPTLEQAMKASVELNKYTGIAFTTAPAVSVVEFDRMIDGDTE